MSYGHYIGDYLAVIVFIALSVFIALFLIVLPFIVAKVRPDKEKLSTYECGFENFGEAKKKFDVRFYLVAILFIIFDLEIAMLFPWAIVLKQIGLIGFWSMMSFLAILIIGFIYELKKGALDWD